MLIVLAALTSRCLEERANVARVVNGFVLLTILSVKSDNNVRKLLRMQVILSNSMLFFSNAKSLPVHNCGCWTGSPDPP